MMKWYIVQSYSGFEKKVSEQIQEELDKADLSDHFDQVLVPTQDVTEIKKGKKTIVKKKYFPGYVLAKMIMTDQIYHLIKDLKKVSGFLGPQGKPSPIHEDEVQKILGNMEESISNPTSSVIFTIGEQVKVSDGPFASFNGLIEEIDEDKSRLKVSVSIFGRPTPVDLDYAQVEKL
ncbi:MAG: transcription termination/antitermination factor NusG [Candidatus Pelagibacter sp.]|mgnify:FL=1|jgi:transcriptional antiterminator NusG|nr:transcription termination/antitermination factor NusG [Candidatus Pelagibacter sp.]